MSVLADILLAALVIAAFVFGCKKGFIKSIWKIAALVITIVLIMLLKTPITDYIMGTEAAVRLNEAVSDAISVPPGGGVNIAENLNLPEIVQSSLEVGAETAGDTAEALHNAAADALTKLILQIFVCVALFVLIRLALMALFLIINGVAKAPVIRHVNGFAGGVLGAVNMVIIVLVLLAAASIFTPSDSKLYGVINGSYMVNYLYNNNILLKLFMR